MAKKWSRAVWKEGDQEEELDIPSSWIEGNFVRWPNSSSAVAALKEMRKPDKTWLKFDLIKVKFSSDSKKECESYDYTTTGDTTEEESEKEIELPKRKPQKKKFSDYILECAEKSGEDSSERGCPVKSKRRPVNLPPPPAHPSTFLARRRSKSGEGQVSSRNNSPLRSDRSHERSRSPARSERSHHRSRSPARSDGSHQGSRSPARSNGSHQRSRSRARSDRSYQRSRSPARSDRSYQRSRSPARSDRSYQGSRSPARSDRSYQRSRSPARSDRSYQRSRSPARSDRSHQRSRSPARAERTCQRSRSPKRSDQLPSTSNTTKKTSGSKVSSLTVFPLTEERFQRRTIFLLTEIRDLLQNKQRMETHAQLPGSEFDFSVVDTLEDLNSLEKSLEEKDFRMKMKTLLMKVGGLDEADSVKKCMQRCLSNAIMAKMNLRGNKGKAAFSRTILYSVMKECILASNPRTTESNIDLIMGKYLKYAPERAGGGGRKEKND